MTVPQERENDPLVLDLLGFGTPAAPGSVPSNELPALSSTSSPLTSAEIAPATRRELRDRERAVEAAEPASRRSAPAASDRSRPAARSTTRPKQRRAAKNSTRRDAVRVATNKPKTTLGRRALQVAAALFAGTLAIGMTVPANAFSWGSDDVQLAESLAMPAQSIEVDPTLVSFAERDAWTVTSWAEMLRLRYGNRSFDYTVGTGPIRWPFPYPVSISSGFGDRAAPCRGCSTSHSGIDFTPGAGAAIFAMADGTVYEHGESGTSWGNYVIIRHEINGEVYFSGYAHMQSASSPLVVGEVVKVGDFVGLVGETGQATGAHLHFTVSVGEPKHYIDPYTFLKTYAS